jgi:hypothetical protein
MLHIILLIALIAVATDTVRAVHRERKMFAEFGQTTAIEWLVWLYPLPLAIPILIPPLARYLLFPIPFGVLFFLPAIVVATLNRRRFERAGTDRVDRAQRAADHALMSGMLAVIAFLCVALVLWILRLSR